MLKRMRNRTILAIIWVLAGYGCVSPEKSLYVTKIEAKPKRINQETEMCQKQYHSYNDYTERLDPVIKIVSKEQNRLKIRIEGNISSAGLSMNRMRRIRLEEGKWQGDCITLKYMAEIKKIPGKEIAGIHGYNYTQELSYKLPKGIKHVKLELYESHLWNPLVNMLL